MFSYSDNTATGTLTNTPWHMLNMMSEAADYTYIRRWLRQATLMTKQSLVIYLAYSLTDGKLSIATRQFLILVYGWY